MKCFNLKQNANLFFTNVVLGTKMPALYGSYILGYYFTQQQMF